MAAEIVNEISEFLQKGRAKNVKKLVQQALDEGVDAKEILEEGLLSGMMTIGGKFKRNEVFVPEVLVAARAMNAGVTILEPKLIEIGNEPIGKAVIGTVKGDLHDIGKNLVVMMMKGAGFEIVDLGTDVPAEAFVDKAEEIGADVIGMSALLTTTMPNMKDILDVLEERSSGWIEGTKSTAGSYDSQLSLYISNDSLCTCKLYSEADCFIFIKIRKYVSASTVL